MIGAIIYAALAADSTIAGLVGTRIYPEEAPNETDLPQIVYAVKAQEVAEGTVPMWPCTVTANCYAEDDAQAETIGQAIRDVLDGFNGSDASYLARGFVLSDYGEYRDQELSEWGRLASFAGWIMRR